MLDLFSRLYDDVLYVCEKCERPTANRKGVCVECLEKKALGRQLNAIRRDVRAALRPRGKRMPRAVALGVGVTRECGEAGR